MVVAQADKDFFIEILNGIGAPITKENLKFLAAWRQAEGGTASNNPFNTTYKLDADSKKTDYNSVGVKNYTNKTYGIAATTKTLKLPYYKNIVKGLQNNIGAKNIANNTDELKTWGTGAGVARVLNGGKVKPPSIGDGTNPKVYSASEETKETEETSAGELAAVEVEESKKITPNWWEYEQEEEVVQEPAQQPQTYSDQLPYDLLSTIPAEDQVLLFGQQMFDEGGIVRPAGDPWEYKKDGDKYLTRKRGSDSWITATGLPEESIKSLVFKEIPVSDRVKEATASYTREKTSQPKSETPRRKEAWRYVEPSESNPVYKKDLYTSYLDDNITREEYELQKDEPDGWLKKKFNISEDYKPSENLFDESVSMDEFNYERFKDYKKRGYSDANIKTIMKQEESGEYSWNPNLQTETGIGGFESTGVQELEWKNDPKNPANFMNNRGGMFDYSKPQGAGNSDWFFGTMPAFVSSIPSLIGYTGFEAVAPALSPVTDPVLEPIAEGIQYVGDGLEYVGKGISSGIDSFGDWTGWYEDGGPKVKQRRGSRKNYDYKTWTPSGLQFPTSESSHLMMAEYDDDIDPSTGKPVGWVGFPSLFQDDKPYANDQDNWVQMSGDNGWGSIYEEAKRRGEVYYFGEDKDAAIAFGEGSWKDQLPDEGIEVELTDEEVEQYRLGGYTVEEIK